MSTRGTYQRLLEITDQFSNRKIVVIGDLIADEFLYGQISRVSREAPVLVLEHRDLIRVPGGAGNTANNLLDLGCRVAMVGVVGDDEAGADLLKMLSFRGADMRHVRKVKSYTTPVKTRILAGAHHSSRQQIVRVDRGQALDPGMASKTSLPPRVTRGADAVILSDYHYGAVEPGRLSAIALAAARIPLVVDSRFRMTEFHGVTAITPNITELEAATGTVIGGDEARLSQVAHKVLRRQKLGCLLVTQGRFGMTLFQPRRPPRHIPVFGTDQVADVTGAGDTVIAVFTLALSCGASCEDAAVLANYAGGIVVMKRGTATVSRSEIVHAIQEDLCPAATV